MKKYLNGMILKPPELVRIWLNDTCFFLNQPINTMLEILAEASSTDFFRFIGQFCEIPGDVMFTVESSVRSALMAVYKLLDIKKEIPPIFKGQHDIGVLFNALKTMHR